MTAAKLAAIVESLGGRNIATASITTISGERFEALRIRASASAHERVLMGDGGPVVVRSFDLAVDDTVVTVEYRRPATLDELRRAV